MSGGPKLLLVQQVAAGVAQLVTEECTEECMVIRPRLFWRCHAYRIYGSNSPEDQNQEPSEYEYRESAKGKGPSSTCDTPAC